MLTEPRLAVNPRDDPGAALTAIIEAARAGQPEPPPLALSVYDADDRLVYARAFGDFAADRRVAIASASKMVSGLVIFSVIGQGKLSLDSTTGEVLGWAAPEALLSAQAREPFAEVTIANSPMQKVGLPYRYGLTAWLECDTPAAGCETISSPGAFGFTPWLDRASGYYAILGMELGSTKGGVVAFSVGLAQQLKPAIAALLGR